MTEETRPGFLANYKIVRPGPARLGQARLGPPGRAGPQFKKSARARPAPVDTSSVKLDIKYRLQRCGRII